MNKKEKFDTCDTLSLMILLIDLKQIIRLIYFSMFICRDVNFILKNTENIVFLFKVTT